MTSQNIPQSAEATSSLYPSSQSSVNPPALTIVLSVACGGVATCILLTIVLLLLRHRSYKGAFRQGEERVSGVDKAPADFCAARSLPEQAAAAAAYLPVLHSDSQTRALIPAGGRGLGVGRAPSPAYPKAVYLDSSRTGTTLPIV